MNGGRLGGPNGIILIPYNYIGKCQPEEEMLIKEIKVEVTVFVDFCGTSLCERKHVCVFSLGVPDYMKPGHRLPFKKCRKLNIPINYSAPHNPREIKY